MSFPAIIDRMLERRVRVRLENESQTVTMLELITRQILIKAGSGHVGAAKVLKRLNNLKRERAQRAEKKYIFRVVPDRKTPE